MNKIVKGETTTVELVDELNFLTLDFENRMKLERKKYFLSQLEIVFTLPLEIIENIIKLNWSKIPKTLFDIKKNQIDLLISETKAPGREIAYLLAINDKFGKKT